MLSIFKNKLVQSIGIYTFSNLLNSAIPFLLLPVLTNYLLPSDYGILSNYNSIIALIVPFISLNLMTSLQIIYVKNKTELASYISSGLFFMVLVTLLFTVITIIFSNQIEEYLGIPKGIIYFVALYAMYQNVTEVLLSLWRMEDKAVLYGIFRVSRTILEISIALILIVIFGETFNGSITALAYSYGIASLVVIYILIKRKILIPEIKKKHIRYLISYGAPLIPHVLGAVIIMNSDKIVLTAYKGLSSNGIYSVGFMVGQGIGLLQNSFNQAWAPFVYDKLKNGNFSHKLRIVKYTYIYFVAILIVSIVFYLFTPIIFNLLGKNFSSGQSLVLWIAIGFAFNGMYKMVSVYFFYEEKTGQIALITIFTSLINIGFLLLLVPKYDEFGAAISTMISMFIQFILTWAMSTRITKMPWNLKSI